MIKSMTGFGKGEANGKFGTVRIELRSVNHKFLEISSKFPEVLLELEERAREELGKSVKRGKINLSVVYEDGVEAADKIVVSEKLAKAYHRQLTALKKKINLEGSIRLDQIITLPGVITYEPKKKLPSNIWTFVQQALKKACIDLDKSRVREGRILHADLNKRVKQIERAATVIKRRSKINIKLYRERLKKSIKDFSSGEKTPFDKGRMEQEVALYAKNSDVTEEIIRILAHVKNLKESLAKDDEVGKKLDFIAQELNREINTVGSKASDFTISKKVIQVKSEIDKLREQAKNIE